MSTLEFCYSHGSDHQGIELNYFSAILIILQATYSNNLLALPKNYMPMRGAVAFETARRDAVLEKLRRRPQPP